MIKILLNMFYRYYFFFKKKNISLEGKIIIKSKPIINISNNANLVIGNNCWIGLSPIILPGTVLGNNCVVAAGSIVRGVFKDNSLIGGNPARYIKSIE